MIGLKKQFKKTQSIGQLSKSTGCNIETIRYYERIGVLRKPPRSEGGHRIYGEMHSKHLQFVRRCRELGFSLEKIRELLRLAEGGKYSCAEVRSITLDHAAEVTSKIDDLKKMAAVLQTMASQCAGGDVPDCPILEVLFDG
ncbi:helix-turn-helix domain-containing protein [Pseudomonadota bacterium]